MTGGLRKEGQKGILTPGVNNPIGIFWSAMWDGTAGKNDGGYLPQERLKGLVLINFFSRYELRGLQKDVGIARGTYIGEREVCFFVVKWLSKVTSNVRGISSRGRGELVIVT